MGRVSLLLKPQPSKRLLAATALLGLAVLFWPARPLRSDNFVFYFPSSHQLVPLEIVGQARYLPLLKVLNLVVQVGGLQAKSSSLTVWVGNTRLELHADEKRIHVDKQWVPLKDPLRVSNGQWMVPVDFLTSVLPKLTREPISYQMGTNRILIGAVKTSSFTARLDPLPNGARLTLQFTDPITVRTEARDGGWVMVLGDRTVEPLESSFEFQNPFVRELRFDDQDGVPKLILTPAASGLNFNPVLAEGGKVLLADVQKPAPVVAEPPPPAAAAPSAAPPAPTGIEEGPAGASGALLPLVVLDAGHGGEDAGARSRDGVLEKNLAAQLVARVRAGLLDTNKYRILLTRVGDSNPSLEQRETSANVARPAFFLTFHAGQLGAAAPRVVIYSYLLPAPLVAAPADPPSLLVPWTRVQQRHLGRSRQLAGILQQHFSQILGIIADGPAEAPVRTLRSIDAPALAIEVGSLSPDTDATPLVNTEFQQKIAAAVVQALEEFQGRPS